MEPWNQLQPTFKRANLEQAHYSVEIPEAAGFQVRPAVGAPVVFTGFDEKNDRGPMAKLEHGRWNIERLRDGWRYGKTSDDSRKIHNCLVAWEERPDDIRRYERDEVRAFPEILAKAGLEIIRPSQAHRPRK